MMGCQSAPAQLFYDFCLDYHVSADHLLREIDRHLAHKESERQMRQGQGIFDKSATCDRFRQSIYDYLYDDGMGLPAVSLAKTNLPRRPV